MKMTQKLVFLILLVCSTPRTGYSVLNLDGPMSPTKPEVNLDLLLAQLLQSEDLDTLKRTLNFNGKFYFESALVRINDSNRSTIILSYRKYTTQQQCTLFAHLGIVTDMTLDGMSLGHEGQCE